jgi:hypothetical protein
MNGSPPVTATSFSITYVVGEAVRARPRGVCLPKFFTTSSDMVEGMSGIEIGPGALTLERFRRLTLPALHKAAEHPIVAVP